ncbi:MAG: glycosyltransferase [Saccharolobus sp.]
MISLVIPAFNEERRIGKTLTTIRSYLPDSEILVIFDGNDNTPEVIKNFPVRLYISKQRLGKGGALKRGIMESSYNKIILIDADLPIAKIEDLYKLINTDADLVITKRNSKALPPKRRFLHHAFIILVKLFFPSLIRISDFQSGVKMVSREKALSVEDELIINDLLFDVNLIYAFKRRKYTIKEVEIEYKHDETDSKISKKLLKVIILMFLSLIKLRVYYSPFKGILKTKWFLRAQNYILNKLR